MRIGVREVWGVVRVANGQCRADGPRLLEFLGGCGDRFGGATQHDLVRAVVHGQVQVPRTPLDDGDDLFPLEAADCDQSIGGNATFAAELPVDLVRKD
jgi:hypothetical protein